MPSERLIEHQIVLTYLVETGRHTGRAWVPQTFSNSRHLFYYFLRENKTRNKTLYFYLIDSIDKKNGLRPPRTSSGVKLRREKI